jgi:hypothetical protein
MHTCLLQIRQQFLYAREGLCGGKMHLLQLRCFSVELLGWNGKLSPFLEDHERGGARSSLELGFDEPGEGRAAILLKHIIGTNGVKIFCVQEQTIHVEETGANGWEAGIGK